MSDSGGTCPSCGYPGVVRARFCAGCGRLRGEDAADYPERRLFGVVPPLFTLVLAMVAFGAALVALGARAWITAAMLVAAAALLYVLFLGSARRMATGGAARAAVAATDAVRDWVGFGGRMALMWSSAGRELFALRRELRGLHRRHKQLRLELGGAVHRDDTEAIESLQGELRAVDAQVEDRERRAVAVRERTKRRVAGERLAIQPTERREAAGSGGGETRSPGG